MCCIGDDSADSAISVTGYKRQILRLRLRLGTGLGLSLGLGLVLRLGLG